MDRKRRGYMATQFGEKRPLALTACPINVRVGIDLKSTLAGISYNIDFPTIYLPKMTNSKLPCIAIVI